jgi:hypothetical protein
MEGLVTWAEYEGSYEERSSAMVLSAIFFVLVGAMVATQFYLLFAIKNLVQQLVDLERAKKG